MLLDRAAIPAARSILAQSDFYRTSHGFIFKAILDLSDANLSPDPVTLREELTRRNQLEKIGGSPYLAELICFTNTSALVDQHARLVRNKAAQRQAIAAMSSAREGIQTDGADPAASIGLAIDDLTRAQSYVAIDPLPIPTSTGGSWMATEIPETRVIISAAGAPALRDGDLVLMAGKAGSGKTYLALQLCYSCIIGLPWTAFDTSRTIVGAILTETWCNDFKSRVRRIGNGSEWWKDIPVVLQNDVHKTNSEILRDPQRGNAWDLTDRRVFDMTLRWIKSNRLQLTILDPLVNLQPPQANPWEIGTALRSCQALAAATGSAIIALSHTRKDPTGPVKPGDPLDAILGTSHDLGRLDSALVVQRLNPAEPHSPFRRLVWAKTRHTATPDPVFLVQTQDGPFAVATEPQENAGRKSAIHTFEILEAIRSAPPEGRSKAELAAVTGISERTIRDLLPTLVREQKVKVASGGGRYEKRYVSCLPDCHSLPENTDGKQNGNGYNDLPI